MTEFERKLLALLDDIEIISSDDAVLDLTRCRFDIAEEHGYTIEFDPEPLSIH